MFLLKFTEKGIRGEEEKTKSWDNTIILRTYQDVFRRSTQHVLCISLRVDYESSSKNQTANSYALNRLALTRNALAIDGVTPEYNPFNPLVLHNCLNAFNTPSLTWVLVTLEIWRSIGRYIICPCILALIQSSGKEMNHDNAPATPPEKGTARDGPTIELLTRVDRIPSYV